MMATQLHPNDLVLNFDPSNPQDRFRKAGIKAATLSSAELLPDPVPWPSGFAPTPAPLSVAPGEKDDLTRFQGYDAIIMTWTVAEATTLATLMTPGYPITKWYQYRHNVQDYIPLVTGKDSAFNDQQSSMYYHSLGLYFPCKIGNANVLLFKSGLHLDDDGPQVPVSKLIAEIANAVSRASSLQPGPAEGSARAWHLAMLLLRVLRDLTARRSSRKSPGVQPRTRHLLSQVAHFLPSPRR